ncbi:MAG: late competence development ComFB family protein [Lachnospiraceae bacterium]|nr:late competence development ComFB family protein [Lachnospiraceae bacterium]
MAVKREDKGSEAVRNALLEDLFSQEQVLAEREKLFNQNPSEAFQSLDTLLRGDRDGQEEKKDQGFRPLHSSLDASEKNPASPEGKAQKGSENRPHLADFNRMNRTKVTVVNESRENDRISADIRKGLEANLKKSVFGSVSEEGKNLDGYHIVNVTAVLLRHANIKKTMEEMGMCTCDRCQADVLALTLSSLKPKYCVMQKDTEPPRISYYEARFGNDIRSAILKACNEVAANPHHRRSE